MTFRRLAHSGTLGLNSAFGRSSATRATQDIRLGCRRQLETFPPKPNEGPPLSPSSAGHRGKNQPLGPALRIGRIPVDGHVGEKRRREGNCGRTALVPGAVAKTGWHAFSLELHIKSESPLIPSYLGMLGCRRSFRGSSPSASHGFFPTASSTRGKRATKDTSFVGRGGMPGRAPGYKGTCGAPFGSRRARRKKGPQLFAGSLFRRTTDMGVSLSVRQIFAQGACRFCR